VKPEIGPQPRLPTLAAWNGASWLALAVYNLALSAIVFRQVSPSEYGVWATIVALRGMLLLIDAGLALGVSRDAALENRNAHHRSRIAAAHRLYVRLGIASVAIGLLGAGIPGALLGVTGETADQAAVVTALFAVETGVTFWASPFAAQLRGRQRSDAVAVASATLAAMGLVLAFLLTGPLGLVGAGIAALTARVAWLAVLWFGERRLRPPLPPTGDRVSIWDVGRMAVPLWIIAAAGQLSSGTDVPIVGAIYGSAVAGRYSVGAMLPTAAVGLLFVMLGAAFPRFSTDAETRPALGLRLVFVGSFLAALGFTTLVLHADAVLLTWLGEAPALSIEVMVVYSLARAVNVPTHVVILMAVASGRYSVLARIAVFEAVASLAVGIPLAVALTPLGPAIGTLVAVLVSNLVVTPLLVLPSIGVSWRRLVAAMGSGFGLGLIAALPVAVVARVLGATPLIAVVVAVTAMLLVAAAVLGFLGRRWENRPLIPDSQGWW
jgi:O-antigen/teichoic acid export membrane protein